MLLCLPPLLHIMFLRFINIFACTATCSFRKEYTTVCSFFFFSIERSHILNDKVLIFGKFSVERERKLILLKEKYCQRCDIKTSWGCLVLSQDLGGEM